ncbi:MAG: cation diffusion facilitator family transporter [Actinomycetota bacterium]
MRAADRPAAPAPADGHGEGTRAVLAALGANLGIAVTKFVAFVITGSASLLAESVHSLADCGNQVLLLVGKQRSRRAETEQHPFGFGTERYFYGFIVAVVLFTVGALFSVYEGIKRISHPEHVSSPVVAFAVLGVAIVLEGLSLRTALAASDQARGSRGLRHFIRHAKAPELPTVLLEDLAALIGLAAALAGVTLAELTGAPEWDGVGSLAIGGVLGAVAIILAIEMKSLLIGESASTSTEHAIVTALEGGPEVQRVIHLRTLHLGPDALLIVAKVAIRGEETGAGIARGIDAAERRVRAAVPIAEVIYIEPDLYRADDADEADPSIRAALREPGEVPGDLTPAQRAEPAEPAEPAGPAESAEPAEPAGGPEGVGREVTGQG